VQLEPGEKSFLAYFPTSKAAERAADELKKAELGTVQVDRISRYEANIDSHYNNPINRAVSISGPTIYSDSNGENLNQSERVLLAADPSASGIGDKDYGVAGGRAFLLTIVTSKEKAGQAESIINAHGGKV